MGPAQPRVTPAGKRGERTRMLRAALAQLENATGSGLEPGTAICFYTI